MSERSRGRPQKFIVTKEKIASVSLKIAEQEGYDAITMAAVARSLGVATSALYNHVRGKKELLMLVQDAVMAQVDTSALMLNLDGTISTEEAVIRWAHSYRDVFSRHSPLIAHIATMPVFGTQETIHMYELLVQVLLQGGVTKDRVMDVIVAFESFIFGSAYDVAAPADIFDLPEHVTDAPGLRRALGQRLAPTVVGTQNPYANPPFELGLSALIRGVVLNN